MHMCMLACVYFHARVCFCVCDVCMYVPCVHECVYMAGPGLTGGTERSVVINKADFYIPS